ncbi:MAG: hypothetical protein WCL49_06355 [bacterium]
MIGKCSIGQMIRTTGRTAHLALTGSALVSRNVGQDKQNIAQNSPEYARHMVDSLQACLQQSSAEDLTDILSWSNHPNRAGHELVSREMLRWFPAG